jgi:hypothetical protein
LGGSALGLAGCAPPIERGGEVVALEDVDLASVRAVLYLSPQSSTWGWGDAAQQRAQGYVVFIGPDGTYELVANEGMDSNAVSWTPDGLFYSDRSNDYLLRPGEAPQVFASPKTDYQDGLVALASGKRVGAFNVGLAEDGYLEEVVVNDGKASAKATTHRWALLVAACGESAFSMDENSGEVDEGVRTTVTLNWLVRDGQVHEGIIAQHESLFTSTSLGSRAAPCVDDEVIFLAGANVSVLEDGEPAPADPALASVAASCPLYTIPGTGTRGCPTIERWDTHSGERQIIPVLDQTGLSLDLSGDAFDWSLYDAGSVVGGDFYWWHSDGHLLRTDLASGETTLVASDPNRPEPDEDPSRYHLQVGGGTAHVLSIPRADEPADAAEARLLTFALEDGALVDEIVVAGLSAAVNVDLVDRGFAVNPAQLG